MLANDWTKTRRATLPEPNHELHLQDQFYGTDPAQINPFNPPRPATTYELLNEDVMVSANVGQPDADAPDSEEANCYTPLETLSKSKQEKLSREATARLAGVDGLDEANIARFTRETSNLLAISHPDVVHDIITRVFSPTVIMTISNACKNLPIRGKFVIHLDDEDRTFLDWTRMSLHLVHEFLDIVKALTSPGSNESDGQKSELAVKTSMNHLLDSNLAELSSTLSFASLRTKCMEVWKTNSRLRLHLSGNSTDIATNACQYLESLKARAYRSKRASYFVELLRVNGIYAPGGTCTVDFPTLMTHLFAYLEQIKNSWVLVTR